MTSPTQFTEVRRYRELPPEKVVEAFKFEGDFPPDFLTEREQVRKAQHPDFAIEIVDTVTGETWIGVREGEYVVRFPTLGLRNYQADSFEDGFEEVRNADQSTELPDEAVELYEAMPPAVPWSELPEKGRNRWLIAYRAMAPALRRQGAEELARRMLSGGKIDGGLSFLDMVFGAEYGREDIEVLKEALTALGVNGGGDSDA